MSWPPRKALMACVVLAGVLIGCRWLAQPGQAPAQAQAPAPAATAAAVQSATSRPPPTNVPPIRPARAERDALARDPIVEAVADPFKAVSFLPPPPKVVEAAPPPPSAPPPKPSAPPFPYRYMGRMLGVDGKLVTYLTRGDAIVPIQLHQVLDGDYRVDVLNDNELVIHYVPLDEKIHISVRSAEN